MNDTNKLIAHLLPALQWLDRRLVRAVSAARQAYGEQAANDPFRGLHLGPADIERMLAMEPGIPILWSNEAAEYLDVLDNPLFAALGTQFELDRFDLAVVLIALAPEIDIRYERLYSYLQDDVARRRPTADLALNLLCASAPEKLAGRRHFAPDAPLIRHDILTLMTRENGSSPSSLLSQAMKLDDAIVSFLLGGDGLDRDLSSFCQFVEPEISLKELPLSENEKTRLRSLTQAAIKNRRPLKLYIRAPHGAGQRLVAHALAQMLQRDLIIVDPGLALAVDPGLAWALQRVFRQQTLLGSVVFIDGYDRLRGDERRSARLRFQKDLAESRGITVISGAEVWKIEEPGSLEPLPWSLNLADYAQRVYWWNYAFNRSGITVSKDEIDQISGRFKFLPEQILQVAQSVSISVGGQTGGPTKPASETGVSLEHIYAAARRHSDVGLASLASKIESRYTWSDIVLPEDSLAQLNEICQQVTHRDQVMDEWGFDRKLSLGKGVTALFAGPSGTGKTMAAEIIANALKLDLYRIDLSAVVSKYIGETEKNMDRIFTTAANANAILFFDEADALFGKRSEVRDAHDRYANIEISYLLQKMESCEGLTILATNLHQNLDDAFVRRVAFTVHFPFPDEANRQLIWKGVWPSQTPLGVDLDLNYLARQFKLSGGNIKNIALASAYLASANGGEVTMEHILHATRREYQKMGKSLTEAELYGNLKENGK